MLTVAENAAGASPRPTVYDAICAFKSLTARECGKKGIFQTSFYDHIIRDERDYITHLGYINDNPAKWKQDEYYV